MPNLQPITIGGKKGHVAYFDANFEMVAPAEATLAKVVFDNGDSAFFAVSPRTTSLAFDESLHPRADDGKFTDGAGERLVKSASMPPKDKPITLVFGGSFNPPHLGHVSAAKRAIALMEAEGYTVNKLIVAPTADKLLHAKLGNRLYPLEERTKLAKLIFQDVPGVEVSSGPAKDAEAFTGKLRRTRLADWASDHHPDTTVVNVTGEDAATGTGSPTGFPSVYAGDPGTNHAGYYYLALKRGPESISSTKIRDAIKAGHPIPHGSMTKDAEAYLRELLRKHPHIHLADWDESLHPRADDGKFTDGSGGPSKPAVAKVPAAMGRWGREPAGANEWEHASHWYHFPEGGDYTAEAVGHVPVTQLANPGKGWVEQEQVLLDLFPPPREGFERVYRIGSEAGGLGNRNAANAKGLIEFVDQMTSGGDYSIEFGFGLDKGMRHVTAYDVKIGTTTKDYKGGFSRSTWGR